MCHIDGAESFFHPLLFHIVVRSEQMAIVYQPQHLAWKERVTIELSKSVPRLPAIKPSASLSTLKPPPRSHSKPPSTRTLNLGYTFGGSTSVKYAYKQPWDGTENATIVGDRFSQRRYIAALQTLLDEEKRRQVELAEKIRQVPKKGKYV